MRFSAFLPRVRDRFVASLINSLLRERGKRGKRGKPTQRRPKNPPKNAENRWYARNHLKNQMQVEFRTRKTVLENRNPPNIGPKGRFGQIAKRFGRNSRPLKGLEKNEPWLGLAQSHPPTGVTFIPEMKMSLREEHFHPWMQSSRALPRPQNLDRPGGLEDLTPLPPGVREEFQPRRHIFPRILSVLAENVSHFSAKQARDQARPLTKIEPGATEGGAFAQNRRFWARP